MEAANARASQLAITTHVTLHNNNDMTRREDFTTFCLFTYDFNGATKLSSRLVIAQHSSNIYFGSLAKLEFGVIANSNLPMCSLLVTCNFLCTMATRPTSLSIGCLLMDCSLVVTAGDDAPYKNTAPRYSMVVVGVDFSSLKHLLVVGAHSNTLA
jgi:hypothetical protein